MNFSTLPRRALLFDCSGIVLLSKGHATTPLRVRIAQNSPPKGAGPGFTADRYEARNAIHWPLSILGIAP
jgi:hypothetical protein